MKIPLSTTSLLPLTIFLLTAVSERSVAQTVFGQVIREVERQKLLASQKTFPDPATPGATKRPSPSQPLSFPFSPMTAREKLAFGFRQTFLRPGPYASAAFATTQVQLRDKDQRRKDGGDQFADGLTRYAIRMATGSTKRMFASGIYPALFRQDPRYKSSDRKGVMARTLYAASRVFITENDAGDIGPNYSQLGANLTASSLANIWERNTPRHNRIGVRPTFSRFARMTGFDVLSFIVFREFGPDIKRKILRRQ